MKTNTHYPKSFSHKGITVPDIHQAVTFHAEVMGWFVIMEPVTIKKEIRPQVKCVRMFLVRHRKALKLHA
jgi:predicted enzyme related to lactoylglutathione lyase